MKLALRRGAKVEELKANNAGLLYGSPETQAMEDISDALGYLGAMDYVLDLQKNPVKLADILQKKLELMEEKKE